MPYNVVHILTDMTACPSVCVFVHVSQVVAGEATSVVTVFNFDILGSHSSWQCVELLLTHLPLLRLLLSVLLGSYKRVRYSF